MDTKVLQKKLTKEYNLVWNEVNPIEKENIFSFNEAYKDFLNNGKTERLCVKEIVKMAEEKGFNSLEFYKKKGCLMKGDKLYFNFQNKAILLFIIGGNSIEKGMSIVGAHIDAPRLDFKPMPLYQENDIAFIKTHYYGGIKKYQWVTLPLAIYGTIAKKNGEIIEISIGDNESEPVFCITDLLPHLASEQMQKNMNEGITGEGLNIVFGSLPFNDEDISDPVKLNILDKLFATYGISEEDFVSAEIEVVPAGNARDVGLDKSFVGAYGQDDRVCAFSALRGILDIKNKIPTRTVCAVLVDKEEIGSCGNTGMTSKFFEYTLAEIIELLPVESKEMVIRRALMSSDFLSADVTAAYDPNYPGTHDLYNAAFAGKGVVISKYGGVKGKSGSNDAHAEFLGKLRKNFDDSGIVFQMGELGRIDLGGGGTIANMLAKYGMNVVDCGPPLLSMHSPFELSAKTDVYMTYKAYNSFFENYQ